MPAVLSVAFFLGGNFLEPLKSGALSRGVGLAADVLKLWATEPRRMPSPFDRDRRRPPANVRQAVFLRYSNKR